MEFLAPTKSLLAASMEPYPCRVCGQSRDRMSPLGNFRDPHDACRRQEQRWREQASEMYFNDPEVRAAEEAIELATAARDQLFRNKMLAADIPEWFANSRVEDLYER